MSDQDGKPRLGSMAYAGLGMSSYVQHAARASAEIDAALNRLEVVCTLPRSVALAAAQHVAHTSIHPNHAVILEMLGRGYHAATAGAEQDVVQDVITGKVALKDVMDEIHEAFLARDPFGLSAPATTEREP